MSLVEAIRRHHQALHRTLQAHSRAVGGSEPHSERLAFLSFLKGDLLPHAIGEERYLYPTVDKLVREFGKATTTMVLDHEFIHDYVTRIELVTHKLEACPTEEERVKLLRELRELSLKLEAIVELHLAKEERVYLPLIEEHLGEIEQERLLQAIHQVYEEGKAMTHEQLLDVRQVPPRDRHTLIFDTFAALRPGEAFVLVNDHDPRPLYYQFEAEHTGTFSWDYLERGPEVWKVRIGKRA